MKYYNNVLFYNIHENYIIQTGDPTGTGAGGRSSFELMFGSQAKYFEDEFHPSLKHDKKGVVSMAHQGAPNSNTSQFFITTRDRDLEHLDGKHTIFGQVVEGLDVLDTLNTLYVDDSHRPYIDARIRHTYLLDDPFDDPAPLKDLIPPQSPEATRPAEETVAERLGVDEVLDENVGRTEEEIEKSLEEKEAKSRAVVLEMIGDLPDADVKPPEEVLFVCKLNPVTTSEDLGLIFSRFGPCKCDIITDFKTGDSLSFGFVEFNKREHCEEAYFKMNNVLIDDRRIKVDFSQSVSKLWNKFARRPWEKHSKEDQDTPFDDFSKNKQAFGNLKFTGASKPRRQDEKYDIVASDDEDSKPKRSRRRSRDRRDDRSSKRRYR